ISIFCSLHIFSSQTIYYPRSGRTTLASSKVSHASFSPYLHSLHVLLSFFLLIFIVLFITHSHFTTGSHPPIILSSPYPQCLPIPPSSVAQFLDSLETSFLCQSSMTRNGLRFPGYTNFLFSMLLILSGDINLNPGPPITNISSLKFSRLNIRSAASITPDLNKPAVLQEFLSGDLRNPI